MRSLTQEEHAERAAFAAARDDDLTNATARLLGEVEAALAEDDVEEALLNVARDAFQVVAPDAPPARRGAFSRAVKPAIQHTTAESDPKVVAGWLANAALNYATLAQAQPGQVKEWVTMRDEDVRHGHRVMDRQTRVISGRFKVMGHRLAYPGQPVGPPEVWLNCRCSLRLHSAMTAATTTEQPSPPAAVVVAVPADDDPIWDASSEQIPHVTLIYLGPAEDLPDLDGIAEALARAAAVHGPAEVGVTERTTLGDDDADVLMLEPGGLAALRDDLLADPTVAEGYGAVDQYPEWITHLTLGYPETPAKGEPPQRVTLDKVALWMGDYEGDTYPLEGMMAEDDATEAVPEPAEDEEYASGQPLTWHGVLAPEGVWSGDRRKFSEDALTWRDLPLPLSWQKVNADGHGGSVVVGNIAEIAREGNLLHARGTWASTPEADEVIGLIAEGHLRGVSVDVDDVEMAYDEANEQMTVNTGRISGATICAIPAFMEAFVRLGDAPTTADDEEFAERPGIGGYPIEDCASLKDAIQAVGRAKPEDRARTIRHIKTQKKALGCPDVDLPTTEGWSLAAGLEEFVPNGPNDKRGPGWVTEPKATRRIHAYWTRPDQPGYRKIGWGAPGDFNRCRTQLAKYVEPLYLNRTCAEWHHDALGIWPGEHKADLTATQEDCGDCDGPALALVAAAPSSVPAAWFDDPGLTEPTPLTITDDGRIFGHLATWGTCHVGISGACVTPPDSPSDYAYFRTGGYLTAEGAVVPVGQITMDTGHAPLSYAARPAAAHYDNTGSVVADVAAGDDEVGIWVAGVLRPGADPAPLLAAKLSGDWRDIGGSLEMVAALAVNTPGFPVPRIGLAASAGRQVALVAAGMLPDHEMAAHDDFHLAVGQAVSAALQRRERARETLAQARALRASILNETVGV